MIFNSQCHNNFFKIKTAFLIFQHQQIEKKWTTHYFIAQHNPQLYLTEKVK